MRAAQPILPPFLIPLLLLLFAIALALGSCSSSGRAGSGRQVPLEKSF